MSNYVKTTDFAAKDTLATANPGKIIKGAEFEVEFDALAVAVNSKADENNAALTGTATAVNLDVSGTLDVQGTLQVGSVSITASAAEINFLDGVTSAIQTQLDARYESGDTLEAASGTASAPGLAFASDTNTGLFRAAADTVGVSVGGTGVLWLEDLGTGGVQMSFDSASGNDFLGFTPSISTFSWYIAGFIRYSMNPTGHTFYDDDINPLLALTASRVELSLSALPTSDPANAGQLWRSGTDLKVSLG
jgi:hypothetical protein